jgi:spore germination protein YaaH
MALAKKLARLARGMVPSGTGGWISGEHARFRRGAFPLGLAVSGSLLLTAGLVVAVGGRAPAPRHAAHLAHAAGTARPRDLALLGNRAAADAAPVVNLPVATAAPAAAPVALVNAPALATREDFAFAPYWTLAQSATFPLTGLSTIDYFSVGVNPNGTLHESGSGWEGYQSEALTQLITRAHAADERVVLTVNDFDQHSLDQLTSSPRAPGTLAAALIPALEAKSLDGVNFDLEGTGSGDQAGLTNLIAQVSGALRAANPHWQITMDTYASSAGDPGGFFNIGALAPSVDAFFVMAYELNLQGAKSAASPLTSGMFSDQTAMSQYTAVVPAAKVILGTPFFGIEWPTSDGSLTARATGAASDIPDAAVQDSGHPLYWDPVTDTGWTSFSVNGQWHESFFESPYALFRVAQLAAADQLRGVGIWALGMESDGAQLISALDGLAPTGGPGGNGPASAPSVSTVPVATSTTTTTTTAPPAKAASTTTTSTAVATTTTAPPITGTYDGKTWLLAPVGPGSVDKPLSLGTLKNFFTTIPAYACLNGMELTVYLYGSLNGHYVAVAAQPTDCVTQDFIFGS